ncbi:MAG: Isopentenyl-diphosphate Delta-isomerase [Microgenomates bacterium 39_7]|nr:MAG: Isopentenyl-diphosphate Delta-isomerase [Microgenomates bacterium 39_7]
MTDKSSDRVILVDFNDSEVGTQDKIKAHRGDGQLHRAISVFLFNDEGKLLIQQRSEKKIVGAGLWANTACGNVRPGEGYLDCAKRRLKEELGIGEVELTKIGKFQYQVSFANGFGENEMDTVFVGSFSKEVRSNPEEVSNIDWIEIEDLLNDGRSYAPWVEKIVSNQQIKDNILEFKVNKDDY